MQKEHVMYAVTGVAIDAMELGLDALTQLLVAIAANDHIMRQMTRYLNESDEDELVQALIEDRIKREQRGVAG